MWRLAAIVSVVMSVVLMSHWLSTPDAYACSAGPDFNPVESSDVVVEGRFTGYKVLPDAPLPGEAEDTAALDPYVPVSITMRVEQVHKGYIPTDEIMLVDPRTLSPTPGGESDYAWSGSGGACGAFNEEPTGRYALMGLTERDDGTYGPSLLRVFFIGDGPAGEDYQRALNRYAMFAAEAGLPALGAGPVSRSETNLLPIAASLAAFGAVVTGGAAAVRYRRRRS